MSVRPESGFSLIELLIVMVLVVFGFTMYFGGGSRGFQTRRMTDCRKNLESMFVAIRTYATDNDGKFPAVAGASTSEPVLSLLVPKATTDTRCFICPGAKDRALPEAQPFGNRKISYAYYLGRSSISTADDPLVSDRQVNTNSKTRGQPLFSVDGKPPGANHNKYGGNLLFCDGSAKSSPSASAFDLTNAPGIFLLNPTP